MADHTKWSELVFNPCQQKSDRPGWNHERGFLLHFWNSGRFGLPPSKDSFKPEAYSRRTPHPAPTRCHLGSWLASAMMWGFKDRVQGIDGELINDWRSFGAVCIPKASGDLRSLQRWRIICLASALSKWYETFLCKQLEKFLPYLPSCIVGYRPGRQCLDIACFLNDMLAKAFEWKTPGAVLSMDIDSAFDNIKPEVAARTLRRRGAPAELVCALVRELTELEASPSLAFLRTPPVPYGKGARQGCPRTPQL